MGKSVQEDAWDSRDDLLLASILSGSTITEAGQLAQVARNQAGKRVNRPTFQRRLAEYRKELREATTQQIAHATKRALDTLVEIMEERENAATVRVSAARALLASTITPSGDMPDVRIENREELLAKVAAEIEEMAKRGKVPEMVTA